MAPDISNCEICGKRIDEGEVRYPSSFFISKTGEVMESRLIGETCSKCLAHEVEACRKRGYRILNDDNLERSIKKYLSENGIRMDLAVLRETLHNNTSNLHDFDFINTVVIKIDDKKHSKVSLRLQIKEKKMEIASYEAKIRNEYRNIKSLEKEMKKLK